jgi:hypothetical protein
MFSNHVHSSLWHIFNFHRVSFRRKKKEGKEKSEVGAKSPTSPKEEKVR